jgi:hypothetical protein
MTWHRLLRRPHLHHVDELPVYMYPPHAQLRVLSADGWCRMSAGERHPTLPNVYTGVFEDGERFSLTLTRSNHAPVLDPLVDLGPEHLKYVAWVRSTFSFVVDALSGERLDIVLQCVKLRVEGGAPGQQRDPFDVVMDEVTSGDAQSKLVLVVGEAASGKSTFARFMVKCLHQRPELQLVPFLLTTIDLMRIIKQNSLAEAESSRRSLPTTRASASPLHGDEGRVDDGSDGAHAVRRRLLARDGQLPDVTHHRALRARRCSRRCQRCQVQIRPKGGRGHQVRPLCRRLRDRAHDAAVRAHRPRPRLLARDR